MRKFLERSDNLGNYQATSSSTFQRWACFRNLGEKLNWRWLNCRLRQSLLHQAITRQVSLWSRLAFFELTFVSNMNHKIFSIGYHAHLARAKKRTTLAPFIHIYSSTHWQASQKICYRNVDPINVMWSHQQQLCAPTINHNFAFGPLGNSKLVEATFFSSFLVPRCDILLTHTHSGSITSQTMVLNKASTIMMITAIKRLEVVIFENPLFNGNDPRIRLCQWLLSRMEFLCCCGPYFWLSLSLSFSSSTKSLLSWRFHKFLINCCWCLTFLQQPFIRLIKTNSPADDRNSDEFQELNNRRFIHA